MTAPSASPTLDTQPIRLAAALVAMRQTAGADPHVFMGRRPATAAFMPHKLVFPGGSVDPEDRNGAPHGLSLLTGEDQARLRAHLAETESHAVLSAALREFREETGLKPQGHLPLTLLARAITPPGRTRRFDAWFFLADLTRVELTPHGEPDNELSELKWRSLDEIHADPLAQVTRFVLKQVELRLDSSQHNLHPPFLYLRDGKFIVTPMTPGDEQGASTSL